MITDIKPQTKAEYETNSWIFIEPIQQFDRLHIVDIDYQPSEERLQSLPMDYRDGLELYVPQPFDLVPF